MEVFSCDTMVALGNSTKSGNLIFAKNSDGPLTEAQPLVVYPAGDHKPDEMVQCTYIKIPQAAHTYRVLGSKPFWIWGFEHGMNEHHVVIGNEAVWAREPEEKEDGLLGMDLLRLGLERGRTAYEALHVITGLLKQYGQGGNAALGMEHRYNNAFLIADDHEAWILDTCGRRWVARRVKDVAGISNCYSTEEQWDEDSGDVKEYAYENGWVSRDVPFNFAKVYSAMGLKHRAAHPRYARLNKLLNQHKGSIDLNVIRMIQRDHFEGEIIEPRWSPADGLHVSICMHAINEKASRTAAAAHIELAKGETPVWWNCFSVPCMSIFAPYTVESELPEIISHAEQCYTENSAWWQFERMQYAMEQDYPKYIGQWRTVQKQLEEKYLEDVREHGAPANEKIKANTEEMLKAADNMYRMITCHPSASGEPQKAEANEVAKQRAKIVF